MLRLLICFLKWLFIGPKSVVPDQRSFVASVASVDAPPAQPPNPSATNGVRVPYPGPQWVLEPNNGRLVVERMDPERVSAGGIVLPDNAQEKNVKVYVLATSPQWIDESGRDRVSRFKPGDHLVISRYAGEEVILDHGRQTVAFVRENDVLARINIGKHADHVPQATSLPPRKTDEAQLTGDGLRPERYSLANNS